jgi:hypothetical protein
MPDSVPKNQNRLDRPLTNAELRETPVPVQLDVEVQVTTTGIAQDTTLIEVRDRALLLATEAKQDVGNAQLTSIADKDFATQATLVASKAVLDALLAIWGTAPFPTVGEGAFGHLYSIYVKLVNGLSVYDGSANDTLNLIAGILAAPLDLPTGAATETTLNKLAEDADRCIKARPLMTEKWRRKKVSASEAYHQLALLATADADPGIVAVRILKTGDTTEIRARINVSWDTITVGW